MATTDQAALPLRSPSCTRCGSALMTDAELLDDLGRVLHDIDRAKLRWPVGVAGDLRVVARALRCRTGTCEVRR